MQRRSVRATMAALALTVTVGLSLTGCGSGQDNVNLYEKAKNVQTDSASALEKSGGKATEVHYPLGLSRACN